MALKTILNLRDEVSGILSGIDISTVANINGCFERAVSTMIQKADMPEASGVQNIVIYSGVYDYLCNPKIFGTAIKDIRPQGISRNQSDFVIKMANDDFDRNKKNCYPSGTTSTFEYSNGTPIIRIHSPFIKPQIVLDTMTDISNWTYNASVTNVATDATFYYQTPSAIRFNLANAGFTGYLEKTLQSSIDLTTYQGVGVGFLAIEVPSANITSYELRIGSDSSNYYTTVNTVGTLGNVLNEFMLIAFDLQLATTVGSPDITKIKYVRVVLNYNGTAMANVRIGGLWISLPTPAQILYKSAAIFLPVGATTPLTTITLNTDEIILTDPSYLIYTFECADAVLLNTGASDNDSTSLKIKRKLDGDTITGDIGLYARYRGDNPSQELRQLGSWYSNEGHGGYGGYYSNNY